MSNRRFVDIVDQDKGGRCQRWAYGLGAIADAAGVQETAVRKAVAVMSLDPGDLERVAFWIAGQRLVNGMGKKTVATPARKKSQGYGQRFYDGVAAGAGTWEDLATQAHYTADPRHAAKCYAEANGLAWPIPGAGAPAGQAADTPER